MVSCCSKQRSHSGDPSICRALSRAELPPDADLSDGVLALHDEFYMCRSAICSVYTKVTLMLHAETCTA